MTSNNEYLKTIAEIVTNETISGTHTDNFYLNKIATFVCNKSYTGVTCNGKYIKDIAEVLTSTTYNKHHFNNYYWRRIAEEYVEELEHTNDNYLLGVIADNISLSTTVRLTVWSETVNYGSNVLLRALVLDSGGQPITGETVTFKESNTTLGTGTTDSEGVATLTISTLSIGSHTINCVYDEYNSNSISVSITKITPTISLSANDDSVSYGDNIVLSGVLSVGSGETVTIYDDNTSLGTVTTTTDGAFSKTVSNASVGNHSYTAVYSGDSTHNNVTSTSVNVSVSKLSTSLEMDVPSSLVYSDAFSISGTLKDENNNSINGASIGLKIGDTIVDTSTTNNNGVVSFTRTPVSMGTHTFQLVYNGDSNYEAVSSSAVTKNINKETSVLSVTSPSTSSTSIYTDGGVLVTGNISDNDSTPITGASIEIKEGNTVLKTLTSDNSGNFTGTINNLSVGTHTVEIRYAETATHTASYIQKTIVVSETSLTLVKSDGENILSYADELETPDSQYCELTATYVGSDKVGKTISFEVRKVSDDSLVETLQSQTTDNTGACSVVYYAKHAGDIYIKASCGLLTQTYSIEDCTYSNPMTSADTTHWTIPSTANASYSENGIKLQGSAWADCFLEIPLNKPYSVEYDLMDYTGQTTAMNYTLDSSKTNRYLNFMMQDGYTILDTYPSNSNKYYGLIPKGSHVKVEINDNDMKLYVDDVLKLTKQYTTPSSSIFCISTGAGRYTVWKNIKIKPL